MRLHSRNAYNWTVRLAAIAAAAEQIKAKSFTTTARRLWWGLTACLGSRSLSRRESARTAILYAFDLIELDGEDLRRRPFLDRKAALAQLGGLKVGIVLNELVAEDGPTVSRTLAGLALRGSSPNGGRHYRSGPCHVWKVRNASPGTEREVE